MTRKTLMLSGAALLTMVLAAAVFSHGSPKKKAPAQAKAELIPQFQVDPWWPKPLPHDWVLGQVGGVTTDPKDNVWITTRLGTLTADQIGESTGADLCCNPAPSIMEFDSAGNYLQGWGAGPGYEFPTNPHGITVDYKGNVWVGGNSNGNPRAKPPLLGDTQIVKFNNTGKFLLQIGKAGVTHGSLDTENFNKPTQVAVWPATNEAFVSDGYGNRRVIVFDADTGQFKRMWGAYGNKPDDSVKQERSYNGNMPPQFNLVHGVAISDDGIVYVADRVNNRIQTFDINGKFIKEVYIERETHDGRGTAFTVAFSPRPDQKYLYDVNGSSDRIEILDRKNLQVIGWFGRGGTFVGQWTWLHGLAVDSKGNLYAEESNGNRVQKYLYKGLGTNQGVDAYWPKKPVS